MARVQRKAAQKRKRYNEDSEDEDNDSPHENEDESEEEEEQVAKKKSKNSKLGNWFVDDNIFILKHKNFKAEEKDNKIASFDFDSTLVEPKSGKKFAQGPTDWRMWDDKVPEKLKQLHKDGYKLVIFTNQGGVQKGHLKVQDVIQRVEAFIEQAVGTEVPFLVFAAPNSDHYRKPATGMWDHMVKDFFGNDSSRIDMANSMYVGDAAGRPAGWKNPKTKKDHSCGDRKFAINVGVAFHTPEEFFLDEPVYKKWKLDVLDIKKYFDEEKKPYQTKDVIDDRQELVLFTGFPASGKSTFYKKHFAPNGYVHVNRDTLGTPAKCQKAAEAALQQGKSVVVDNTNPDAEGRKAYLQIARKAKVRARCFQFTTPRDLAEHLNLYREKVSEGVNKHVPGVGYNMYKKKKQDVSAKEGWDEVKEIDFIPDFVDDQEKKRFYEYT